MYCVNCGSEIPADSKFCPECGYRTECPTGPEHENPRPNVKYDKKSDALAIILSIILPGAGHIYLGDLSRGLMFMITYVLLIVLMFALFFIQPFLSFIIPVAAFVELVYAVYDSYQVAKRYNDALSDTGFPPW